MNKKKEQLGMNPSTASGRLVKDILWNYIVSSGHDECYRCGSCMTREDFSIEHKVPWLDSEDPVGLYFDLDNISFSHRSCNSAAARKINKKYDSDESRRKANALRTRLYDQSEDRKIKRKANRTKRFKETGSW